MRNRQYVRILVTWTMEWREEAAMAEYSGRNEEKAIDTKNVTIIWKTTYMGVKVQ